MDSETITRLEAISANQDKQIATLLRTHEDQQKRINSLEKKIKNSGVEEPYVGNAAYWTGQRVRDMFVAYFMRREGYPDERFTKSDSNLARPDHMYQHSSPVVPVNDKTLLFANAGMNQFKPIFLGQVEEGTKMEMLEKHGSAANSQKCIRAGGKHNDLEDVGRDNYHHTFFEMLGNWSFGTYFKTEAIDWAWDLLTNVYGLDGDRLYATYFEGDPVQGLDPDVEAQQLWMRYLPANRVIPGNAKDNFWEMGETGPCGPCSELHYDRIGGRQVPEKVNQDDPNVLEIWNIVFMQFNREADGSLKQLPAKCIDTGMGLERVCSVLQNKSSNYDTDLFTPIFDAIYSLTKNKSPYQGRFDDEDPELQDMAYRVIADHIRTLTFAIADGARPSNEHRGYVLRRILRRGVYYGKYMLGLPTGFFSKIVPSVVENFKASFPELISRQAFVQEVILDEEESFAKTIEKGMKYFSQVTNKMKKDNQTVVSADDATFLYDTMGFPVDLTQRMAEEMKPKMTVDMEGFQKKMEALQDLARRGAKQSGGVQMVFESEQTDYLANKLGLDASDDMPKYDVPVNGDSHVETCTIQAIYDGKNFVESASQGASVGVVTNKTPFYPEGGGQVGDSGTISGKGFAIDVQSVNKFGLFVLHVGTVTGSVALGVAAKATVDAQRRQQIAPNHTGTHVLNLGLRKVLGPECDQKGSIVNDEKLRFDFNSKPVTPKQIERIEQIVNDQIQKELSVFTKVVPLANARKMNSLRAVFGEEYPDPVRVVSVGVSVDDIIADPTNDRWMDYSVELCGGTHVTNLAQLQSFVIVEESNISKGIRRITAVTRGAAAAATTLAAELTHRVSQAAMLKGDALVEEEKELRQVLEGAMIGVARKAALKKELDKITQAVIKYKKQQSLGAADQAQEDGQKLGKRAAASGEKVTIHRFDFGTEGKTAKKMLDAFAKCHPAGALLIVSAPSGQAGKVGVYARVPSEMATSLSAKEWVKATLNPIGGKGGGKPEQATGTGNMSDPSVPDQLVAAAKAFAGR